MQSLKSIKRVDSKAAPGVVFLVRTLSEGRRIKLALKLAGLYSAVDSLRRSARETAEKVSDLLASVDPADAKAVEALNRNEVVLRAAAYQREIEELNRNKIYPEYVRALLAGVEGLEIDGAAATVESMIEEGTRELYAEALEAVLVELGLSEAEMGNSASPTTSAAPADGRATTLSAEDASGAETTL